MKHLKFILEFVSCETGSYSSFLVVDEVGTVTATYVEVDTGTRN